MRLGHRFSKADLDGQLNKMSEKHKPIKLLLIWVLVAYRNSSVTALVAIGKSAEIRKYPYWSNFNKYSSISEELKVKNQNHKRSYRNR